LAKDSGPCSSAQGETLKAEAELEPFVRLIEALEPWLEELVLIGGWAHRLYRLAPRAQGLGYPPLTTLDSDISVPSKIEAKETSIRDCLLAAGFQEEFIGRTGLPRRTTTWLVRADSMRNFSAHLLAASMDGRENARPPGKWEEFPRNNCVTSRFYCSHLGAYV
jgi:hypothetical protein